MKLKIIEQHYGYLRDRLKANLDQLPRMVDAISGDCRVKDPDKRLRWDLLWASVSSSWVCDNLYPYMDDTHIDSALRQIMREIA